MVRLAWLLVPLVVAAAALGALNLLSSRPAPERLAGVSVELASRSVVETAPGHHRLTIVVSIASGRDIPDCLRFALDEPFGSRLFDPAGGAACVRPRAGLQHATLTFDRLTDDDVRVFGSHAVVWGAEGGRCGPILDAMGVCSLDAVDKFDVSWPVGSPLPSLAPISFPIFSFGPLPS